MYCNGQENRVNVEWCENTQSSYHNHLSSAKALASLIITNRLSMENNVAISNTLESSEHRKMRYKIMLDLKAERVELY